MAQKVVDIDGIGPVTLVKSSKSKAIRISIARGKIRVSMPTWMPYATALTYAHTQRRWIELHAEKYKVATIEDGQRVGKYHTVTFTPLNGEPRARITKTKIIVSYDPAVGVTAPEVQEKANEAAVRALKKESERLLGPRIEALAARHDIEYSSIGYKRLKRRWGSCDSKKHIVLNIFLVELPWELIDYVIIHELAHTKHMDHSDGFWRLCKELLPASQDRRHELKRYDPVIGAKKSARA